MNRLFTLAVGSLFGVTVVAAAHILFVDGLVAHDPCRALLERLSAVPRLDTAVIGGDDDQPILSLEV